MWRFDHLALSARTLEEGTAHVEAALGVALAGGGKHAGMGTHNRLLGLGDIYFEVIAADPDAPAPATPRSFDLDRFTGAPRLTNWIARVDDLATRPPGIGPVKPMARGDFRWEMTVPEDGRLPFDGCHPALIRWHGDRHPTQALPDAGVRLTRFEIAHPQGAALAALIAARMNDPRVVIVPGPEKAMRATFETPHGRRVLD